MIECIKQEFGTTNYMVKKSRALKKEKGMLEVCDKISGKPLSKELKVLLISMIWMKIAEFFQERRIKLVSMKRMAKISTTRKG